jgi:hypothetical protein
MGLRLIGGLVAGLCVAGCAGTATDASQPLDRACTVTDCFLERDVRDFEVIDPTTLVVYVGNQGCAFQIELRGTFCDLTFAPEVYFSSPREVTPGDDILGGGLGRPARDLRVCSGDLQIGVTGGVFTENPTVTQPTDRFGNARSQCQITSVESLTDDELVELYVSHGVVAPPPPMGAGQIEVGEQGGEGEASAPAPEEGASQPPLDAEGRPTARATPE